MTDSVRDAVFGNVGTTISFRVSADDAPILSKQFEPVFEAQDLLNLNNRHFVLSMIINGEKTPAFSATTLSIPKPPNDLTPQIIRNSRMSYARSRSEVEKEIKDAIEAAEKWKKNLSDSGREAGERGSEKPAHAAPKREKPVFEFTPQAEFRKQKISPSQAQGEKTGPGLKDLGALLAAQQASPNIKKTETVEEPDDAKEVVHSTRGDDDEEGRQVITSAKNGQANVHTIQKKNRKISYHKHSSTNDRSNRPIQRQ